MDRVAIEQLTIKCQQKLSVLMILLLNKVIGRGTFGKVYMVRK